MSAGHWQQNTVLLPFPCAFPLWYYWQETGILKCCCFWRTLSRLLVPAGLIVLLAKGEREKDRLFLLFVKATMEMAVKLQSSRQQHTIITKNYHADFMLHSSWTEKSVNLFSHNFQSPPAGLNTLNEGDLLQLSYRTVKWSEILSGIYACAHFFPILYL